MGARTARERGASPWGPKDSLPEPRSHLSDDTPNAKDSLANPVHTTSARQPGRAPRITRPPFRGLLNTAPFLCADTHVVRAQRRSC